MTQRNFRRISEIFLACIALSSRVISRFKRFLRLIDLEISIFLEQIFTSGVILNETAKTKSVKIY